MYCVKTPSSPKQDDVFVCSNCGKSCGNNKANVLAHETKCFKEYNKETGERKYVCHFCGSKYSKSNKRGFKEHMANCVVSMPWLK